MPWPGVHDWSRYRTDPLGRLTGTIRWIVAVTFGDTALADEESARVGRFHNRVSGTYSDRHGQDRAYSAHDAELLDWVHLAFTEAFLGCAETWGPRIPGGADQYVAEWAIAGHLVGVQDPPRSRAELRGRLDALRSTVLRHDERVDDVVRFIKKPPLPRGMMPAYRVLFAGAVASMPVEYRRLLGLRRAWWPAITATRIILAAVALALGQKSTSEDAARRRLARLESEGRSTTPIPWTSDPVSEASPPPGRE